MRVHLLAHPGVFAQFGVYVVGLFLLYVAAFPLLSIRVSCSRGLNHNHLSVQHLKGKVEKVSSEKPGRAEDIVQTYQWVKPIMYLVNLYCPLRVVER